LSSDSLHLHLFTAHAKQFTSTPSLQLDLSLTRPAFQRAWRKVND